MVGAAVNDGFEHERVAQSPGDRALSLIFHIGGEEYLIEATHVLKVVEVSRLNRLPRLPPTVLGITQHRGRVVTVFDLGALLYERPAVDPRALRSDTARIILLDRGQRNNGLLVEAIDEITSVSLTSSRNGPVPALRVVQHRGRALHALQAGPLMRAILNVGPSGDRAVGRESDS